MVFREYIKWFPLCGMDKTIIIIKRDVATPKSGHRAGLFVVYLFSSCTGFLNMKTDFKEGGKSSLYKFR